MAIFQSGGKNQLSVMNQHVRPDTKAGFGSTYIVVWA